MASYRDTTNNGKIVQIYEQSLDALRNANADKYIDSLNPHEAVKLNMENSAARLAQYLKENKPGGETYEVEGLNGLPRQQLDFSADPYEYTAATTRTDALKILALQREVLKKLTYNSEDYYILLANIFQSITAKGLTTWETVDYIYNKLVQLYREADGDEDKQKQVLAMAADLKNVYSIFHKPYNGNDGFRQLHGKAEKDIRESLGYAIYSNNSEVISRYGPIFSTSLKEVRDKNLFYNTKDFLNHDAVSLQLGEDTPPTEFEEFLEQNTINNVNDDIRNPKRYSNPSMSAILVTDNDIRCGTKNSIELSAFFNLISNIEFTRAHPYFNATFILPSVSKQDKRAIFKTATINQFMFGSRSDSDTTYNYQSHEAKITKVSEGESERVGVEANLSIFSIPQSILNMNEKAGHRDIYNSDDKKLRLTSVHNKTTPFLTLKNFELNIAPTKGLMNFKSGQISLVLHDRTRMADIAPFIKADLFGSFGAEIAVEYGWRHPDAGRKNESGNSINPIGDFLGSSKCLEKYMITNSQFSVKPTGEVEINLSVAMKGPIDIRQTEIVEFSENVVTENNITLVQTMYLTEIDELAKEVELPQSTVFLFSTLSSGISNIFKSKYIDFSKKRNKAIEKNIKRFQAFADLTSKILKTAKITSVKDTNGSASNEIKMEIKGKITAKQKKSILSDLGRASGVYKGWKLEGNNIVFTHVNGSVSKTKDSLINIGKHLADASSLFAKAFKLNKSNKEKTLAYVNSLIGGITHHDFFYDTLLEGARSQPGLNFNDVTSEPKQSKSNKQAKKQKKSSNHANKYLTFGSLLMSLTGTHMLSKGKYDEIQFVFHNVNEKCGLASNIGLASNPTRLNIASLLIKRVYLESYLKNLFETKSRITLENLITQIIQRFILTKDNPCFGLEDLFERTKFDSTVKPITDKKRKNLSVSTKNVTDRLNFYYYGPANIEENKKLYDKEGIFNPPNIKLSFECLTSNEDLDRTILRISVYDENDNPYQSLCNTFNQAADEKTGAVREILKLEKEIKRSQFNLAEAKKKKTKKTKKSKKSRKSSQSPEQIQADIVKKANSAIQMYNNLTDPEKGVFGKDGNDNWQYRDGKGFLDLKENFRRLLPTINFASNNSILISAGVATVNEGKLNTVYITRQDRNNVDEVDSNVVINMPLRVLPSTANFETFGCPWINFGQYVFLDLETGTTIDNTYVVTNIKHSMSPGKFNTSVTLSYGDVYGKYEGLANAFTKLSKFIPDAQTIVNKNEQAIKDAQIEKARITAAEQVVKDEKSPQVRPVPNLYSSYRRKVQTRKKGVSYSTKYLLFSSDVQEQNKKSRISSNNPLIPLRYQSVLINNYTEKLKNIKDDINNKKPVTLYRVPNYNQHKINFTCLKESAHLFFILLFYLSIDVVYCKEGVKLTNSNVDNYKLSKDIFKYVFKQFAGSNTDGKGRKGLFAEEVADIEKRSDLSKGGPLNTKYIEGKYDIGDAIKFWPEEIKPYSQAVHYEAFFDINKSKQERALLVSTKCKTGGKKHKNKFIQSYGVIPVGGDNIDNAIEYKLKYILMSDFEYFNVKDSPIRKTDKRFLQYLEGFNRASNTFEVAVQVLGNIYFYTVNIENRKIFRYREDTYRAITTARGASEGKEFVRKEEHFLVEDQKTFFELIPDEKYILSDKISVEDSLYLKNAIINKIDTNALNDLSLLTEEQKVSLQAKASEKEPKSKDQRDLSVSVLDHQIYIRKNHFQAATKRGEKIMESWSQSCGTFVRFDVVKKSTIMQKNDVAAFLAEKIKDKNFEYFLYLINNYNNGQDYITRFMSDHIKQRMKADQKFVDDVLVDIGRPFDGLLTFSSESEINERKNKFNECLFNENNFTLEMRKAFEIRENLDRDYKIPKNITTTEIENMQDFSSYKKDPNWRM